MEILIIKNPEYSDFKGLDEKMYKFISSYIVNGLILSDEEHSDTNKAIWLKWFKQGKAVAFNLQTRSIVSDEKEIYGKDKRHIILVLDINKQFDNLTECFANVHEYNISVQSMLDQSLNYDNNIDSIGKSTEEFILKIRQNMV
jgi:hypothetical protein